MKSNLAFLRGGRAASDKWDPPSLFTAVRPDIVEMTAELMRTVRQCRQGRREPMPALIFDCDGVLADTERYGHLPAFNQTFAEFGVPVRWSEQEYARSCSGSAAARSGWRSLLTPEFVAADGPADRSEAGARPMLVATGTGARPTIYTDHGAAGAMPARPGVAGSSERPPRPAGNSRSRRPRPSQSVRAVLDPRRRRRAGRRLRRVRRRRGAGQEACAGHLPARRRTAGCRPGPGDRGRGQPQRDGGGARRRADLRRHHEQLHRATRTSPVLPSSSPAWATRTREPRVQVLADPHDVLSRPVRRPRRPEALLIARLARPAQQGPCP